MRQADASADGAARRARAGPGATGDDHYGVGVRHAGPGDHAAQVRDGEQRLKLGWGEERYGGLGEAILGCPSPER